MMIWLPLFVLNALLMVLCYLTNPLVVLFADEEGELKGFLHYWQTWDDSINPRFFILEKVPGFLRHDYDRHYVEFWDTTPALAPLGHRRCFAKLIDPNFTLKERLQRYICRVLWLTRNCGYGFSFYMFGRTVRRETSVERSICRDERHALRWGYDAGQSILTRVWWVKVEWFWSKHLYTEGYLGWKVGTPFKDESQYSTIAHRLVPIKIKLR